MGTNKPKQTKTRVKQPAALPFYRRKVFFWLVGLSVGVIIIVVLAFKLTPWPGTILIRSVFNKGSQKTLVSLQKHTPQTPITVVSDQQYIQNNNNALLDVYIPQAVENTDKKLPIVIWTHGGAWVSGDKTNAGPYYKLIAAQEYIVVSLNYTLAPYKKYPEQIYELNQAHGYVVSNAERFHGDPNKIFLAGDSAGAQLSSQMAAIITNPDYAKEVKIRPALSPAQLAGTILFCGIYKLEGLTEADPKLPKILSWGDDEVVRAYSGTRDKTGPIINQMSPYYFVTKDFPATFISGGNGDPLTDTQSKPLADKLQDLGVSITTLFYAADHMPSLPHEYQFNLDNTDGQNAFTQMIDFLRSRSK